MEKNDIQEASERRVGGRDTRNSFAGIAETYLMKAIGQCTGQSLAQVRAAAQKEGDLGRVAHSARARQRTMHAPPPLSCRGLFAALQEIARMTGACASIT